MEKFKNLYEVTKTVRFGLQSYNIDKSKNENYNIVSEEFSGNSEISEQLEKYKKRITEASSEEEWEEEKKKLQASIKKTFDLIKDIKKSLESVDNLKNNSKHNLNINFKTTFIKKSCGFGKDLFHFTKAKEIKDSFPKKLTLSKFNSTIDEYTNLENVIKHYAEYSNCKNKFEAYKIFLDKKLEFIESNVQETEKYLKSANHEKARLTELNINLQKIIRVLKLIDSIYLQAIGFSGNIKEEVSELRNKIIDIKNNFTEQIKVLEEISENIHDPKHGYEVGKASLHYRTINKRFIPNHKAEDVDKLLGNDSIRGGEFHNPLAEFSGEILKKIKEKEKDTRLDIEKSKTIIEKAQFLISLVREIEEVKEEDVTLWNICNALNNKRQVYNEFITQEVDFKDLGWKQKLKFGLTVLMGCDIYKNGKLHKKECLIKHITNDYINKIGFKEYEEYKKFTQKIDDGYHKRNKEDRGKLFSYIMRDYVLVNKEISQIRGGLQNYKKYLESAENNINMIQYFSVLVKNKDDKNLLLFIEREKAKEFYQKINSENFKIGNEKLYLYDSLTEKALKKLFDQTKSGSHPFKNYKQELANQCDKSFDKLKFDDLRFEELKQLFQKDIALEERWKDKFMKFYNKFDSFKDKKELLQDFTKNAFLFKEKSFDLGKLQEKFPNLIVVRQEMNTNQNKNISIHKNYFERAFNKMKKHEDVDVKINPEFQIYFNPEKDKHTKKEKIQNILKRGFNYNEEKIETNEQSESFCKVEHRFWRNVVTIGMPIEIQTKKPTKKTLGTKKVIGIDRGEKKIATICVLEKNKNNEYIVPIEYFENSGDWKVPNWESKKSYFLDLAQFKIGKVNGKQKIIKWQKEDKNLELKKYEFITRFIKTIWTKANREKIQKVLSEFDKEKIGDEEYVRQFILDLTYTDKEVEIENKFFNNHLIGAYQETILKDSFVLEKLSRIIGSFNGFDFQGDGEEKVLQQQSVELGKIRFRDTVASNIAGIVDFMFRENIKENIETYCALENLHNSTYFNFVSEDKTAGNKIINDDFVEFTHNKLYQTGVYGKVKQAIMNKLQVHKKEEKGYFNYSFDEKRKNQIKEIQFELKNHSKSKRETVEEFQGETLKIQESKFFGNIVFVDPSYTSKRCPKCNIKGGNNIKRQNKETRNKHDDKIECKSCGYKSNLNIEVNDKIKLSNAHRIISTGDENGSFFIGLRCVKFLN